MKHVYILTKESNIFTDKGCYSVHDQIRRVYDEAEDVQFMDHMGDIYNHAGKLADYLKYCKNEGITAYVVISERKHGTWAFGKEYIDDIIKLLEANPDGYSWQLIMDNICTPIRDEHHKLVAEGLAEPIEGEEY